MNGQAGRQRLVAALLEALQPEAILDSVTHYGTTTAWLADQQAVPVHTVEASPRFFGFASARLRSKKNVKATLNDSHSFLCEMMATDMFGRPHSAPLLAYLDAHWRDEMPLRDKLEVLFGARPDAVVIVSDFEVEGDDDYSFHDPSPGERLDRTHITVLLDKHDLTVWYPACPGAEETGQRLGCIVLASSSRHGARLDALPTLRRAPWDRGDPREWEATDP